MGMTPMEMIELGIVRTCGECGRRRRVKDWYMWTLYSV